MTTGQRMRYLRKVFGYNGTMVAAFMGVTQPRVSQWETGSHPFPDKKREKLAKLFGLTLEQLVAEDFPHSLPERFKPENEVAQ